MVSTKHLFYAALLAAVAAAPAPSAAFLGFGGDKDLPSVNASIGSVEGGVQYKPAGTPFWIPAPNGQALSARDEIKTDSSGAAVIAFSDGTKVRVGPSSAYAIDRLSPGRVDIRLTVGVLDAWIKRLKGRRFAVRTPSAVASVRGTEFRTEVEPGGGTTWNLFGGQLDLNDAFGRQTMLDAGNRVVADALVGLAESKPAPLPPEVKQAAEPAVELPPAPPPAEGKGDKDDKEKKDAKKEDGKKGGEKADAEGPKTKVVSFTGKLVITMPDGKVVTVEAGKPVPDIPPGASVKVENGVAVFVSGGSAVEAKAGATLAMTPNGQLMAVGGQLQVAHSGGEPKPMLAGKAETVAPPPPPPPPMTDKPMLPPPMTPPPAPKPGEPPPPPGDPIGEPLPLPPPPPPPNVLQDTVINCTVVSPSAPGSGECQ